jgi:hypothetical protein
VKTIFSVGIQILSFEYGLNVEQKCARTLGPSSSFLELGILAGQLPSSTRLNLSLTVMSNNKKIIKLVLVYSTAWCHTVRGTISYQVLLYV